MLRATSEMSMATMLQAAGTQEAEEVEPGEQVEILSILRVAGTANLFRATLRLVRQQSNCRRCASAFLALHLRESATQCSAAAAAAAAAPPFRAEHSH